MKQNTETFEQLFEQSLTNNPILPGAVIIATVERIENKYVVVDAGLKSESYIPIEQFYDESHNLAVNVGDEIKVSLEVMEDGFGSTRLSRERAKRLESWSSLETAHQNNETVQGIIVGRVKGGFTVEINKVKAFLPGSLVDLKPIRNPESLEFKTLEFKVIKVDVKRNNIVVSRRAVLEAETHGERTAILEKIREGDEILGVVKNLTDYGAFIDLGGIDGLLHVTDISWKRTKHPGEVLKLGDEVKVKVLKVDRESARISLGLKQLGGDPWQDINQRYPAQAKLTGCVTNITDYGCFVELETGIEGLVHVSEMDWTNKNVNPSKILHLGQEVEVMVLDVDADRRRISLGLKQCTANPWEMFASQHQKGETITGKIKSITDFGIFIELEGGIDGLIYLSDIAWNEKEAQEVLRQHQKGDELKALILAIDVERERIALGLKQLSDDPIAHYLLEHPKGEIVQGTVTEIAADAKHIMLTVAETILGVLRVTHADQALPAWQVGDSVSVKVSGIDKKSHAVALVLPDEALTEEAVSSKKDSPKSNKATSKATKNATNSHNASSSSKNNKKKQTLKATLGDLLKGQIEKNDD